MVGDVIDSLKYGTAQRSGYEDRAVPVLRIPNVVNGVIDHSDLKYAKLPPSELEQLRLTPGDILLVRSNGSVSLVGRTALVRQSEEDFAYAGYLIRLRPRRTAVTPEFLNLALGSFDVRLQIELEARSTSGVHNINGDEVRALTFALPPLGEQREILRRVNDLFELVDRMGRRLAGARDHVEKLTPALLAKAFRGELVSTEAEQARDEGREFESTSALIERVRASRTTKPDPGVLPATRKARRTNATRRPRVSA
jgi:type I restriction enzyme S subunit